MGRFVKEYGYLAVMCVCLVCCAVLLVSVATDRPLVVIAQEHIPVMPGGKIGEHEPQPAEGETRATRDGFLLTEAELEQTLADFLPDDFPASDIGVKLGKGLVELKFSMDRSALKTYLKAQGARLGTKQELLFRMLPRRLNGEAAFGLTADEQGLHLQPLTLDLGGRSFDLSAFPPTVFSAVDEGLNALLKSNGVSFSKVEFTEDGLLLK